MKTNIEKIEQALSHVMDPDLGKDLISLGMIEEIQADENRISFDLVLTTPACPMKAVMEKDCREAIAKYISPDIEIIINMKSKVKAAFNPQKMQLEGVKHIITVGSGKGGVGKSTVAANLAIALSQTGAKVALVDADIYGPSLPIMFDLLHAKPEAIEVNGQTKMKPIEKYGIKLMSIGFFIEANKAVIWRGPIASNALKQMFNDTLWGEVDYLVVDLPPGTGDIQITIAQSLAISGAILVSTPQQLAISDVRKAADMFMSPGIEIPILGLIENMAYFTPAELPQNKYYIFGKGGCESLSKELNLNFLGQIPLVESLAESGDKGNPIVLDPQSPLKAIFSELAQKLAQNLSILLYK